MKKSKLKLLIAIQIILFTHNMCFGQSLLKYKEVMINGKKVAEGNLYNDAKVGVWIYYHENGTINKKQFYYLDSVFINLLGRPEDINELGRIDTLNSQRKLYKDVISYENKMDIVQWDTIIDTVVAIIEIPIEENYSNGKTKIRLVAGDSASYLLEYGPKGHILTKYRYVKGALNGEAVSFFSNGNIAERINYENGIRYGAAYFYRRNGKIKKTITYNR